jgi:uncharacterized protein (TIGR03435 family)
MESGFGRLTAPMRERLGLELASTKGSVDVVVIDRVEPPIED